MHGPLLFICISLTADMITIHTELSDDLIADCINKSHPKEIVIKISNVSGMLTSYTIDHIELLHVSSGDSSSIKEGTYLCVHIYS